MARALVLTCTIGVFVTACAVVPAQGTDSSARAAEKTPVVSSVVESAPIDDLEVVADRARDLPEDSTLVVFDIDDTLLTTAEDEDHQRQFFGSDRWFTWQYSGLPEGSDDKISPKCLFEVIDKVQEEAKLVPTQANAIAIEEGIGRAKLILTSRSPSQKAATIRQLESVGYTDKRAVWSESLTITVDNKVAAYEKGILLTQGADKGHALVALLAATKRKYDHVVMVDDTQKNLLNVALAMSLQGVNFDGLRYNGVKNDPPLEVSLAQVCAYRRDWFDFLARHRDQAPRWTTGQCGD